MDGHLLLDLSLTHLDGFQKWSLVCAAALTIVYAVMRPLKKRKDSLAHPATMSLAGQREVEKQMTELLVELEQMARQMTAQLETRATKLELLIAQADERLVALRRAGAELDSPAPIESPSDVAHLPDPRHAAVYDLRDQGLSARQIAQRVGKPYGEIELILALRPHEAATA